MKISVVNKISFQRQLKPSEEKEYSTTLKNGKKKVGNNGKSILIVPSSSLPNKTGVGNLATTEGLDFIKFAQQYWGINELQILPIGQYFPYENKYSIYSSSSMDLGNHVIDIKNYVSKEDYQKIVDANKNTKEVNFANIVDNNSIQEKILCNLYETKAKDPSFIKFKQANNNRLEPKAIYNVLAKTHNTHKYDTWPDIDKNLYNSDFIKVSDKINRISEIYKNNAKDIDYYYFKQYLAEDSLKRAKAELNNNNIKLDGDMLCGFSNDEIWSNPKAFHKNKTIGWGTPALNLDSAEGKNLLRQKVRFNAERFDNIRVDASWTYIRQPLKEGFSTERKYYKDSILKIIEDEVKNVKGPSYDLRNIMHEIAASPENFNPFKNTRLRDYLQFRTKIYTSDYMSPDWGSNTTFLARNWDPKSFIIGATNHDSGKLEPNEKAISELSRIFQIPKDKLKNKEEFIKAKFAEPIGAYNNMLYYRDCLGLEDQVDSKYKTLIPKEYKDLYFKALANGSGFNPMDALEKQFKLQGLDKTEPELYKKIVKYNKILSQKEKQVSYPFAKIAIGSACLGLLIYGSWKYYNNKHHTESK